MKSTPHLNEHFLKNLFYRVHVESMCNLVLKKPKKIAIHGVHVESMWSCGLRVESMRTLWGRVKYTRMHWKSLESHQPHLNITPACFSGNPQGCPCHSLCVKNLIDSVNEYKFTENQITS